MFVMLYNNFVNPTHLIYCYQTFFSRIWHWIKFVCILPLSIYSCVYLFWGGERWRCWDVGSMIDCKTVVSRFSQNYSRWALIGGVKFSCKASELHPSVFKPGFRMTSAKICLTSEKILLFCSLGESPSLYEIMIVIHVLLETNVYVSETSPRHEPCRAWNASWFC